MRVAFAGNPNSGKTTIYNALTGRNECVLINEKEKRSQDPLLRRNHGYFRIAVLEKEGFFVDSVRNQIFLDSDELMNMDTGRNFV